MVVWRGDVRVWRRVVILEGLFAVGVGACSDEGLDSIWRSRPANERVLRVPWRKAWRDCTWVWC